MRSKRQTVWLVSMLSLMVLLSAYYLFTEDSPQAPSQVADGQEVTTMDNSAIKETVLDDSLSDENEVIVTEVASDDGESTVTDENNSAGTVDPAEGVTEEKAEDSAVDPSSNDTDTGKTTNTPPSDPTAKDEDVLKQLENQGTSSADSLTAYQFQRSEQNMKKQDELLQAINDENKTLDEAVLAQKELSALEEKEERIYDIEEKLQQKYSNAVVQESDNKYKVVVLSDKLEAKEAVTIMDLVIKELGVSQDKVSVQYITQ